MTEVLPAHNGIVPADAYGGDSVRRRRSRLFPYLGGRGFGPIIILGAVQAGVSVLFPVLVLRRADIAVDLSFTGVAVERYLAALCGAAACGALLAGFVSTFRGARVLLQLAAMVTAGLFGAIGAVNEVMPLRILCAAAALTAGAVWSLGRVVALDVAGPTGGWRVVAGPWTGAAIGVAILGAVEFVADRMNWGYELAASGVVLFLAAALIPPARSSDGVGAPSGQTADRPTVLVLAFALGVTTLGAAPMAADLLATKWQFDISQSGGIVMVAALGAAGGAGACHWFGAQARRSPRYLAGMAAALALSVGGLMAAGGASVTEFGALFGFCAAAGAAAVFAVASESSLVSGTRGARRYGSASLLVGAFGVGAGAGIAALTAVDGVTRGWLLVIAGLPAVILSAMILTAPPRRSAGRAPIDISTPASSSAALPFSVGLPQLVGGLSPPARAVLLECSSLNVSYGPVQVLFGVDLRVEEGQLVALLGTNGAGKTTLLRTVSGLESPTSGTVSFGGVDITSFDPTWRVTLGISQIAGGRAVAEGLTVAENLRLFGFSLGRRRHELSRGIDEALALFPRLAERRNQAASTLSGGEKQMLALSKAVILRPRLLIIDEFSLGLAPIIVGELLPVVQSINASGTAILLVEQSVNIALSVASHAYCMEKGEMVYDGPASVLRDDPELMRSVYLEGVSKALAS